MSKVDCIVRVKLSPKRCDTVVSQNGQDFPVDNTYLIFMFQTSHNHVELTMKTSTRWVNLASYVMLYTGESIQHTILYFVLI